MNEPIASRFNPPCNSIGGVGQNHSGGVLGDPSNADKIQAKLSEVTKMSQVSYRWRVLASVAVPEYAIPYRPMVLREAGRMRTIGPSRTTNVQRCVLDFLSRYALSSEARAEIRAGILENYRPNLDGFA